LIVDQQTREQFFINAVVTEHFVLQSARGAMIGEMVGRGSIYLGTVSSALIAFGFIAQSEVRLAPFVAAVLPALFVLGELTFVALPGPSGRNARRRRARRDRAVLVPASRPSPVRC